MNESKTQNPKSKIFLGVDGGQSHTEAIAADENGCILGRGFGGASNHAEQPGGRERLRNAVRQSVGEALQNTGFPVLEEIVFASAHFGMTGGADFKEEIIREIVKAEHLQVTHDAPTALYGATAGKPGIVVIAGTGSVVYGENEKGKTAKIGGLGYLFSDEGSGFWLAAQTIRLAIKEQDGLIPNVGLERLVLDFFKREQIREVTNDFYFGKLSRDRLASLSRAAHEAAAAGNSVIQNQIRSGAAVLVESVERAASRLGFEKDFPVAGVGGMFRAVLMKQYFAEALREKIPGAVFTEPHFNPAIGALLLAFRKTGIEINEDLLTNLAKNSKSDLKSE
ncbi:MAG TPA: BadF/BadG/BcrA/BcrD ATPase family protein [Pyrinomonadaceae bacterium]